MKIHSLLLGFLLLTALVGTGNCQSNPTPVNHLLSVLQASLQQLQSAAQISSAQQAYSTVTLIVNQILKAMQQMSLPYYQNQLIYLQNQQISLSNRLTALQSRVSGDAASLLKLTGAVSSSLAAQTQNIGFLVLQYINQVNGQMITLNNKLNGLELVLPSAVLQMNQIIANASLVNATLANVTSALQSVNASVAAFQAQAATSGWFTFDLPALGQPTAVPYCESFTFNYNVPFASAPKLSFLPFSLNINTGGQNALDFIIVSESAAGFAYWACDRSKSTYTFIPTRIYVEFSAN